MENTETTITPARKPVKKILGWVITIAAVGFCAAAIWKYWEEFRESSEQVSPWLIVSGSIATMVAYVMESWGWHVLVNELNGGVKFRNSFRAWAYSQVAKYTPGKVMVLVIRAKYCGRDGMRTSKVAAGTILEIILSLVCAVSISIAASLWTGVTWGFPSWFLGTVLLALIVLIHPWTIKRVMRFYYKLRKVDQSETPQLDLLGILKPLGIYFIAWTFYGFGGYLLMRSLGVLSIASLGDMGGIIGAFTLAWAGGYMFLPAPGGVGGREAILIFTLKPWVDPLGVRIIISILARFCQSGMDMLLALLCWSYFFLKDKRETAGK